MSQSREPGNRQPLQQMAAYYPPPLPLTAYSPTSAQYNMHFTRKPDLTARNFPPRSQIPHPRVTKQRHDSASRVRKCYENYNHYIMRQVVEDKSKVIWPPEVEAVFMEALWLIPGTSRKILVGQKTRGRNEIIADYLEYEIGEKRSRKQVSSHLQVLKKLLVEDQEFLDVVGPKRDPEKQKSKERTSAEMSVSSFGELITKLKNAKLDIPKPAFLLQAQFNAQQSQDPEIVHSMSMNIYAPHLKLYSDARNFAQPKPKGMRRNLPNPQQLPGPSGLPQQQMQPLPGQEQGTHAAIQPMPKRRAQIPLKQEIDTRTSSPDSLTESETTPPGASAHPAARPTVMMRSNEIPPAMRPQRASYTRASYPILPLPGSPIKRGPPMGPMNSIGMSPLHQMLHQQLMPVPQGQVPGQIPQMPGPMPIPASMQRQVPGLPLPNQLLKPATQPSAEPPMKYPKPLHSDELPLHVDSLVAPPASVPPQEEATQSGPRLRVPKHRRTASASVDISGDKVLPVQFRLLRKHENITHVYSRLLRPSYESPTNPLPVNTLLPRFNELNRMLTAGELNGVQVVHAQVILSIKPMLGTYLSDVQFMVTRDTDAQHRYFVRTTVSSRGNDLLTCDAQCAFQSMAGRGLEQDKDLISVPYLPDFFTDFLHRVENTSPQYVDSALEALSMCQAVYISTQEGERLCFLALYQFSSAEDEFSARTRFRRVSGVPPSNENRHTNHPVAIPDDHHNVHPTSIEECPSVKPVPGDEPVSAKSEETASSAASASSTTTTAAPNDPTASPRPVAVHNAPATPNSRSAPQTFDPDSAMAALNTTPGNSLMSLGHFSYYDNPTNQPTPRRAHLEGLDLTMSPFNIAMAESRGSPRIMRGEITRPMSAFEPSVWDEFPDWVYQ